MREPADALAPADRFHAGPTTAVAEQALERAEVCASLGAVRILDAGLPRRFATTVAGPAA